MMAEAVLVGGTDTTRNQLGCTVALFANYPEQWKLLADQPDIAPRAVEESMRYFGTIRGTGRLASEDIEYRDVLFPAGTFIAPSMATANRDPSVFPDPEVFDITREPSGQPQLTFGSGIHYCLGAARSPGRSSRRHCRCWPGGCPTSPSTARSRGSPTPSASSAPSASRSRSPRGH